MSKDFLGQDLKVGDHVIYCRLNYRSLKVGTITKITNCCVFLDPGNVRQDHSQVVKVVHNE